MLPGCREIPGILVGKSESDLESQGYGIECLILYVGEEGCAGVFKLW